MVEVKEKPTFTIEEGLHSELGPSSSDRWMNCPGSVLATRGMKGQSEYAAEGTAAHTLSQWVRETGKPAADWKGWKLKVGEFQFTVGKPMIESVQTFVDDCAKQPGDAYYETMVRYDPWVLEGFGTLDDARIGDNICTVTDLKHGTGVKVFAHENSQLKLYALGLFWTYGWMYDFDKFVLRICQPRLRHFESFEISLGRLMQWAYDVVRPAARLTQSPNAPIIAGSWCKFCKLKETCEVRAEYKRRMKLKDVTAENEFEDQRGNNGI